LIKKTRVQKSRDTVSLMTRILVINGTKGV
jgi:hypothetical protein